MPPSAAKLPFTTFVVTAGSQNVTLNSVVVQKSGLGDDDNFTGVVLLDETGSQIGLSKTLNSLHQATIGEATVIPAGTTRTFTIAGNIAGLAAMQLNAGQVVGISVVALNADPPVSGTLPITGAQYTANATLTIGSVTVVTSSLTNVSTSKEIGTTNHVFAGIRVTAGSAENIRLRAIR
ncbi:MAG: hypothetical protein COY99_02220, partial [Candidatus Yonathbacteria bacterium CG_4_10_14_0_8_um_filter_47_645]